MKWPNGERLSVDKIALAQHYELDTGYLDLSHDFDVAAFFATCYRRGAEWQPQIDGIGIAYRIELSRIPHGPLKFAQAVGLQPLPRPEQQRAWVANRAGVGPATNYVVGSGRSLCRSGPRRNP